MAGRHVIPVRRGAAADVFASCGVRDPRILTAMRSVPRDAFGTSPGTPSPDAIARVLRALDLQPTDRVLKIGTGSGWTATVLGRLAGEVWAVEQHEGAALDARTRIATHTSGNVHVVVGDGTGGLAERAPFDAIALSIVIDEVPERLVAQLAPSGRLVAVVRRTDALNRLIRVRRLADGSLATDDLGEDRVTPLLGDLLVATGRVDRATIEDAAQAARARKVRIGEELLARGACDERDLYQALATQRGDHFASASEVLAETDPALGEPAPRRFLEHHQVVPVCRHDDLMVIASPDPDLPRWAIAQALGVRRVQVWIVTPTDYRRICGAIALGHVAKSGTAPAATVVAVAEEEGSEISRALATLRAILLDAVSERASDIHLESYEGASRVRFRVDGNLTDVERYDLPPVDLTALVNVIKLEARLDIAERRLPQGGRSRQRVGDRWFDLRVQTQPCLHHEHVVIRLLPQEQRIPTIEDLGFPAAIADRYLRILRDPHGLVLVVGPTGSGKSTTLYTGLQILAGDRTRKVITVEDPIEYSIPRVQQTQVNLAAGFGFADAMRAFVREDPDVILVGEIRDAETALEAIRASQTGHLVLSTLHCNDAIDAVQRLIDLGAHANSVASELSAIFAQRLARRICVRCRRQVEPDSAIAAELFPLGWPAELACYAGAGCDACAGRGTSGRVAVVEFLAAGPEIRCAISRRAVLDELRELARRAGLVPLRSSALALVGAGVIPLSEIPDVLSAEQMAPDPVGGKRS